MAEFSLAVLLFFLVSGIGLVFLLPRPIEEETTEFLFSFPSPGGGTGGNGGLPEDTPTVTDTATEETSTQTETQTTVSVTRVTTRATTGTTTRATTRTTTRPTTKATTEATTKTTTLKTTKRTTTTKKTTTTTVEPRVVELVPRTIFCTVGREVTSVLRVPADGICDFMYYTHVYWIGDRLQSDHTQLTFDAFLEAARQGKATRYGVSVRRSVGSTSQLALWQSAGEKQFKHLWDQNVHHHGILDAYGLEADLEAYERYDLKLLRSLRKFQRKYNDERRSDWRPSYVALGVRLADYANNQEIRAHAARIKSMVTSLPVHLLIAMSHVDPFNREDNCKVIAPTPWQYNYGTEQPYLTAVSSILQKASLPGNITVMRSMTMAILYHKFDGPERTDVKLGDSCRSWTLWNFQEICSRGIPNTTTDQAEMVQLSSFQDRFFSAATWDTAQTFALKMRALEASSTLPNVGWAFFDTEMGDHGRCSQRGGPSFPRLRAARTYFKYNS